MQDEEIQDDGPTEEEFKYMLQQAVLQHYPNPEREGCLDSTAIQDIARQRLPNEDSEWEHISHCSPCYREFLDNRDQFLETQARVKARRRKVVWMSILTAVGLFGLAAATILKGH
jgi:hypothetical protein